MEKITTRSLQTISGIEAGLAHLSPTQAVLLAMFALTAIVGGNAVMIGMCRRIKRPWTDVLFHFMFYHLNARELRLMLLVTALSLAFGAAAFLVSW